MSRHINIDLGFKPYRHQSEAHALRLAYRFLVLVWHRRAGKTVFAVMELLLAALSFKGKDGRFAYIAPLLKQAKSAAWDYLKHYSRLIPSATINESELYVEFPNGARIRIFGADNPDALRGIYLDGVVLDEVADMKPEVWGEIVRPALADRGGWAVFIGTPKGVNLFSELYYRALSEPEWKGDLRRALDTGVIQQAELEQMRREMTPAQYAQEIECDFAAAVDDVLLTLDVVLAAQRRSVGPLQYESESKILGVDVARYGDDLTVLFPRQGPVAYTPKTLRQADTMTVASFVAQTIDSWKPDAVFIDVGGVGAGASDRLRQLGYSIIPVDFGGRPNDERYENKRAEMWWQMADWVKTVGCLPDLQRVQLDLTGPKYTYKNKRGRLQLESKDDMRARGLPSTDFGDALCCTFHSPVAAKNVLRLVNGREDNHEWNPLESA